MPPAPNRFDVVVLGAGVIGLSVALELQSAGLKVAVVAKDLPGDINAVDYASPWAGCLWFAYESDPSSVLYQRDMRTFKRLKGLVKTRPDLCDWCSILNLSSTYISKSELAWADGKTNELVSSPQDSLPEGFKYATSCSTLMLNAPKYTEYLGERARSSGITFLRKKLTALDEAYAIPELGQVDLVVNATGLGARGLGGVEDKGVYPSRGQTVLVRAPKVRRATQVVDSFKANIADTTDSSQPPKPPRYILPRPGTDGHVILGGTYDRDNYSPLPDSRVAEDILKDCFDLDSNLAVRSWRDIEVLSVNVGLRPSRNGGQRVELERRKIGDRANASSPKAGLADKGRQVGVIHAYGFGGVGFISSLGAAEDVVMMAKEYKGIRSSRL